MTKKLAILGFGVLLAATAAQAGTRFALYVSVGSTYAYGSIGSARGSADSLQYIGCSTLATAGIEYATCYARDISGTYGTCRTYDAKMIRAVATIGSDSTVEFHWSGSSCTYIAVQNDSRYSPRQP